MMKLLKRLLLAAGALLALTALLVAIEYFGGQPMGLFAGSRPAALGFNNGKFAPPSWKPNCVSSSVEKSDGHFIEPIAIKGSPAEAWKKLIGVAKAAPRTLIVTEKPDYLYAEFKTSGMGFVDDVEFALDEKAGVIQVRSASRLGVRDFNVNRNRIEGIRSAMK
jgi:uncharacterized protein (DUF1499 family)